MFQFIETILAESGTIRSIELHQQRLNKTLRDHNSSARIDLPEALAGLNLDYDDKLKIRVCYDLHSMLSVEKSAYQIKVCHSFSMVEIGEKNYRYKYADREWIYAFLKSAGTDEIIMLHNGRITDSSIANLAFFNGDEWHTPQHPLLKGTRRMALLEKGIIKTAIIDSEMLTGYLSFKLINAMMEWDESPVYPIGLIQT